MAYRATYEQAFEYSFQLGTIHSTFASLSQIDKFAEREITFPKHSEQDCYFIEF